MKKAVKLTISGTVQGIFFRQFCKESADKLGLKGFIRNLKDGDVEIVLEGGGNSVEKMIKLCKKGPPHAQIKNIAVEEKNFSGEFNKFKILRF